MNDLPIKLKLKESFFEAETICDYEVTTESKQLWAVLLDLMVTFDAVCKQYNIRYSIDSGTLLGAVRHGGFIPWDNDADVIMLRSEYNKLCAVAPTAFAEPYFWQTNDTDPGSMRRHGQLRNSQTTCILTSETSDGTPLFHYNQGVFLDVFILDEVPDDVEERHRFQDELQHALGELWDFKKFYADSHLSPWMEKAQKQAYDNFETLVARYNGTGKKRVGNIALIPQRKDSLFFLKELYEDLIEYDFEGYTFAGPRDYETILSGHYGDWHQLVRGAGDAHGEIILDLRNSYRHYLKPHAPQRADAEERIQHPILKLYRHRDMLLTERDKAWADNRILQEKLTSCQQKSDVLQSELNDAINVKARLEKKEKKHLKVIRLMICISLLFLILSLILLWRITTI